MAEMEEYEQACINFLRKNDMSFQKTEDNLGCKVFRVRVVPQQRPLDLYFMVEVKGAMCVSAECETETPVSLKNLAAILIACNLLNSEGHAFRFVVSSEGHIGVRANFRLWPDSADRILRHYLEQYRCVLQYALPILETVAGKDAEAVPGLFEEYRRRIDKAARWPFCPDACESEVEEYMHSRDEAYSKIDEHLFELVRPDTPDTYIGFVETGEVSLFACDPIRLKADGPAEKLLLCNWLNCMMSWYTYFLEDEAVYMYYQACVSEETLYTDLESFLGYVKSLSQMGAKRLARRGYAEV